MITNLALVTIIVLVALYEIVICKGINRKIDTKEIVAVSAFFFVAVALFFAITGLYTSGYHLTDDHDVYSLGRKLSDQGFFTTVRGRIVEDAFSRFRPLYWTLRIIQVSIFGDDFVAWHIMYAFLSAVNLCLGYFYARYRGCMILPSFVFAVSLFKGSEQTPIMWRLGPQENLGILIVLLTFIFLRLYHDKRKTSYLILSIIFTLSTALIKEAFLLIVPAYPVILVIWNAVESDSFSFRDVVSWIRRDIKYTAVVILTFVSCIAVILICVGDTYRISEHKGIIGIIKAMYDTYIGGIGIYVRLAAVAIILGFSELTVVCKEKMTPRVKAFLCGTLVLLACLCLQFYLHADVGMTERYLVPSTLMISLFVYVFVNCLYMGSSNGSKLYYYMFVAISGYVLFMNLPDQYYAEEFTRNGHEITACLARIGELASEDTPILVDLDYEEDKSASIYLEEKYGVNSVYNVNYSPNVDGRFHDVYNPSSMEDDSISETDAKIMLVYTGDDGDIVKKRGASDRYRTEDFGSFTLYIKERTR